MVYGLGYLGLKALSPMSERKHEAPVESGNPLAINAQLPTPNL